MGTSTDAIAATMLSYFQVEHETLNYAVIVFASFIKHSAFTKRDWFGLMNYVYIYIIFQLNNAFILLIISGEHGI